MKWNEILHFYSQQKSGVINWSQKFIIYLIIVTGYWTDNGAFYYYNTLGENKTYEDTFLELNNYFTNQRDLWKIKLTDSI